LLVAAEAEQGLEGGQGGPASVESEDELVQVDLQVLGGDAFVGALQRRFLSTGGTIHTNGDRISVRLDRRIYSPVLRSADSPTFRGGAAARCIWTTPDPGTRAE
jgi:hypothetical protein